MDTVPPRSAPDWGGGQNICNQNKNCESISQLLVFTLYIDHLVKNIGYGLGTILSPLDFYFIFLIS